MDLLAIDVTGLAARVGDEVVLVGASGDESVRVAELAAAADTVPYELLCLLGLRLPRITVRSERPVSADAVAAPR
jgi:alanine racemase